jgi:hypothetical protein
VIVAGSSSCQRTSVVARSSSRVKVRPEIVHSGTWSGMRSPSTTTSMPSSMLAGPPR